MAAWHVSERTWRFSFLRCFRNRSRPPIIAEAPGAESERLWAVGDTAVPQNVRKGEVCGE